MSKFLLVERRNHNALHAMFDSLERAEQHLREVMPEKIARGYLMDKTLRAEDFEIVTKPR